MSVERDFSMLLPTRSLRRGRRTRWTSTVALAALLTSLSMPGLANADPRRHHHRDLARHHANRNHSDNSEFDRTGVYLGAGLVGGFMTRLEGELTERSGLDNVDVDPSGGLAARVGIRVTPRIAVEAHYEWMGEFETSFEGRPVVDMETSALSGDVKGYLATGRVQPYLLAGAGVLTAKSDDPISSFTRTDTGFAMRFGGGIDVYVNPNVGVSLDTSYVVPTGDVEDLDYVSIGLGMFFRF